LPDLVVAHLENGLFLVDSRYRYGGASALLALFGSAYFGELTALKASRRKTVIQKYLGKAPCCLSPEARSTWTAKRFARLQQMRT